MEKDELKTDKPERTEEVLKFILSYIAENAYPPSVREIGAFLNMKSTATVHYYLKKLEDKGAIKRSSNKNRSIEIMPQFLPKKRAVSARQDIVDVPLVGKIAAGVPITAVEAHDDIYPLPKSLFGRRDGLFMLTVKGESMIEAGILDGDKVVARQQNNANNGEIVVALINGEEATLKRFYQEDGYVRLKPENSSMSDIIVEDVQILGIAVGLIRDKI